MPAQSSDELLKIAILLHRNDRFQDALNYYNAVLTIDSNNKCASYLLGVLLLQNGFDRAGNEFIQKSIGDAATKSSEKNSFSFINSISAKWQAEIDHMETEASWPVYDGTTVDKWRHHRMIDFVSCFSAENATWLTVGDAYGHDFIRLRHCGVNNVVASNINARFLKLAHEAGSVADYLEINAESIALPDNSFDYVLCKEALHHMPRAPLAIYEMLRVARKAVFLVEPQDTVIDLPITKKSQVWFNVDDNTMTMGKNGNDEVISKRVLHWYEHDAGNYVYTISRHELTKLCNGMGLPGFFYKNFNDCYNQEWADQPATEESDGFKKTKEQIALHDQMCALTGFPANYLNGLIFKSFPAPEIQQKLQALGYTMSQTRTQFLPILWPNLG